MPPRLWDRWASAGWLRPAAATAAWASTAIAELGVVVRRGVTVTVDADAATSASGGGTQLLGALEPKRNPGSSTLSDSPHPGPVAGENASSPNE